MVRLMLLATCALSMATASAQNKISTPVGQSLKMVSDTVFINGHMRIDSGVVKLNNYKFLSTVGLQNTFIGNGGNLATASTNNTIVGANSGLALTSGVSNNFFGINTGKATTTGRSNVFFGSHSGLTNTTGGFNTFVGNSSGNQNTTGSYNLMIGENAGSLSTLGSYNTYVGRGAGSTGAPAGEYNTYIGYTAGGSAAGSRNVFIGALAGQNEAGSDKLYIANSNTATPLIYGDFAGDIVRLNGKVAVNTTNFPTLVGVRDVSTFNLFVKGGIVTEGLTVKLGGWADYVFDKNYKLRKLKDIERFISQNGHLPGVPSAYQVETDGASLGELKRIQQEKIEELVLYAIERDKILADQKKAILAQQKELLEIRQALGKLVKSN
jgi:hypothetical protein